MLRCDMRGLRVWVSVVLVSTGIAFGMNQALVGASPTPGAAPAPTPTAGFTWVRIESDPPDEAVGDMTCRTNPNRITTDVVVVRPDERDAVIAELCLQPTS
jgi:hypothetical protein